MLIIMLVPPLVVAVDVLVPVGLCSDERLMLRVVGRNWDCYSAYARYCLQILCDSEA